MNNEIRVVITAMGVISPIGIGKEEFSSSLKERKNGIKDVTLFDTQPYQGIRAGEITDFQVEEFLGKKGLRNFDRSTRLLLSATKLAFEDSGRELEDDLEETGTIIGTGFGGIHSISSFDRDSLENPNYVNPTLFPNTVINAPASQMSIRYGIKKYNMTVSNLFTSSTDAIGIAYSRIKSGKDKSIFAGGVEELCEEIYAGFYFNNLFAGTKEELGDGVFLGEGAVVFLIEELEYAKKRGAKILAEIIGYGTGCDAEISYGFNKEATGAKCAMKMALESSGTGLENIDIISMSSNGDKSGADMEEKALRDIFGDNIDKISLEKVKMLTGECIGASGAMQVAAAVCSMQEANTILINSFGCNGLNSSLIVKKFR